MARLFATPCAQPGCKELVYSGGRCTQHRLPRKPISSPKPRIYDLARWDAVRISVFRVEPWCKACELEGKYTRSMEIDHIVPIEAGGDPWARTNLQALCKSCHSRKTLRESIAART